MPPSPGIYAVEAPQEVVALLVGCRCAVRLDRVVAGVEVLDDALDRPALAAGIGPFEDDEQAGTDLAPSRADRRGAGAVGGAGAAPRRRARSYSRRPSRGDRSSCASRPGWIPARSHFAFDVMLVRSDFPLAHSLRCYGDGDDGSGSDWSVADRGRKDVHAPTIAAHRDFELAGVWTRRPEVAAELAAAHGSTAFDSVGSLDRRRRRRRPRRCRPRSRRRSPSPRRCAGRHLILEKPLAESADAARRGGRCRGRRRRRQHHRC